MHTRSLGRLSAFHTAVRRLAAARVLALGTLGYALAATGLPAAATAADADVVVTGSRLSRGALEINGPLVRIDEDTIERSGAVNVEDLIRQLPQSVAGISPGVNLGNPGVAALNLRGLRNVRTLVLVDGKRFVPFDYGGAVDVNNIPIALLDSIEVVTGGASAVYGSDAMAGVVNFRLKRDFEGLEFGASLRRTGESDGTTADFTLTGGLNFAGGRGNAMLHLGWTDREAVSTANRDFSRFALATANGSLGGSLADTQGSLFCIPSCFPSGSSSGQSLVSFSPQGDLAPTGSRLFNYNLYNYLQVPQDRIQGTALLNFDFTDTVSAYGRLTAAESNVDTSIAPSGTFFTRTFDIPLSSPFLNAQARAVLSDRINSSTGASGPDGLPDPAYDDNDDGLIDADAVATEFFTRRTLETGLRETFNRTVAWQALAGLRGALGGNWRWDLSWQFGRTELTHDYTNDISEARMQASILGCPPGSPPGCVPGNFFGDGNLSAEAARFIALELNNTVRSDQQVAMAALSGTLGDALRLPGTGPIRAAFGLEYRREDSEAVPDDCLSTPGCSGGYGTFFPVSAEYSVRELFGELLVPLLEDRAFARALTLETGVRFSDYSNVGGVTAWKFGGSWAPLSAALRLRGLYQKAVRAPNIFEFGSPIQQNRASGTDPCAGMPAGPLRDLCVATGVPAAIIDAGEVPVIAGQVNVFEGGNPDLIEEDSDTLTAGLVWAPAGSLEGLSVQLDWYRIRIDNAITTLSANDVLSACYSEQFNPQRNPDSPACRLISRNPATGGLADSTAYGISRRNENIAFLETEGVDLGLDYRMRTDMLGEFRFSLLGTRVLRNERKATAELPVRECAGRYGSSCGSPDPKLRFNQQTTWTIGEFDLGYRWRYLEKTRFDNPPAAFEPFRTLAASHYVDLLLGWKPARFQGLSIRAGVDNLLDKEPPLVGEDAGPTDRNSGNTYPGTFDVLGRTFFVGATQRF
jgi:outer membrane receptor protein involved in Fe transport